MKKITQLLTRSNKQISQARAHRITKSVDTSFQKKVLNLEGEISQMEDKRERLLDMSSSNVSTTKNAVDDLEADGFVDAITDIDIKLELKRRHIKVVKQSQEDIMGDVVEDTDQS